MKTRWRLLVAVLSMATSNAAGASWQEELTSPRPGAAPPLRALRAHYKFGWTAFTAAEASFNFAKSKGGLTCLTVTAKTIGFPRTLWRMDARHTALMQTATLRPVSVRHLETNDDVTQSTRLDFDATGVSRLRDTVPPAAKRAKTKRFNFPGLFDLHSSLHFVRSQRLAAGDVVKLLVYPTATPYLAHVSVVGRPKMNIGGRSYDAIKLDLKLWEVDADDLKLKAHQSFQRASIWISDDADRLLLKIEGEVFVGSVWAELQSVEYPSR